MIADPMEIETGGSDQAAEVASTQRRAHRLTFYDQLTGLPNRRCFEDVMARLRHSRHLSMALLLLDIDDLATVNDISGHEIADDLIRAVGSCLQQELGSRDVFRIGGDEFAIVETDCASGAELASLAERLLSALLSATGDRRLPKVSVSVGGALTADGDLDVNLSRNAGLALRRAKESNRGGYVAFDEGMRAAVATRAEVLGTVSAALADGRMSTYYQPLVMLEGREVIGLEALSRMRDTAGNVVPAGLFQAAFSDPVIATRLTDEMLRQVASDIRNWLDEGVAFQHVGINLSAVDFERQDLEQRISEAFRQADVPLEHVVLEVTEAVFIDGMTGGVVASLGRLKRQGMLVALDDFGTGFASLTHLLTFPADIIKIDKSFIDGITSDLASKVIVEALIMIAARLDLRIVAEGIETEAQAQELHRMGCKLGQGYLFGKPASADETETILKTRAQPATIPPLPLD